MSGKNKVTQAGMDGVAICSRASGSIGLFLALINKADEADLKNDPYLQLADDELKKAMGFDMPLNVRSCIQRARNALRLAKDIDFSDDSIHDLKKKYSAVSGHVRGLRTVFPSNQFST